MSGSSLSLMVVYSTVWFWGRVFRIGVRLASSSAMSS